MAAVHDATNYTMFAQPLLRAFFRKVSRPHIVHSSKARVAIKRSQCKRGDESPFMPPQPTGKSKMQHKEKRDTFPGIVRLLLTSHHPLPFPEARRKSRDAPFAPPLAIQYIGRDIKRRILSLIRPSSMHANRKRNEPPTSLLPFSPPQLCHRYFHRIRFLFRGFFLFSSCSKSLNS